MAAEGYKVQISGNIGNALFVLLGDDVAELEKHSEDLKEAYDRIAENLTVVQQVAMAKEVFSAKQSNYQKSNQTPTGSVAQPQESKPAASTAPAGPTPSCSHGEMVWKDFVSKAGNEVKGHFCTSSDRDDTCPPKFAKKAWKK